MAVPKRPERKTGGGLVMKIVALVLLVVSGLFAFSSRAGAPGSTPSLRTEGKAEDSESKPAAAEQEEEEKAVSQVDDNNGGRLITFHLAGLEGGKSGDVVIQTKPEWAPLGVAHFHELIDDKFYDEARFFRVVNNFVVQWGIAADPKNKRPRAIKDDPVVASNDRGTITYAMSGPNTRSTQLFINTRKNGNAYLDKEGFAPIGLVISGMEFVDAINGEYAQKPNQGLIQRKGNEYLSENFPRLSYISTTTSGGVSEAA